MAMEKAESGTRRARLTDGRARTIIVACGAGLGAILIGLVAARASNRVAIIGSATGVPGSPGDTTADLVLGQFDLDHNGKDLIDGFGLWMNLAGGAFDGDVPK
jgi:hypothetical protein